MSGSVPFWAWKSITIHENHCQRKEPPEVTASSKVFSPIWCIPGVDILVVFFNSALSRSICTCSSMHCTSITLSYDTFFSWIPFRFHSNKSISPLSNTMFVFLQLTNKWFYHKNISAHKLASNWVSWLLVVFLFSKNIAWQISKIYVYQKDQSFMIKKNWNVSWKHKIKWKTIQVTQGTHDDDDKSSSGLLKCDFSLSTAVF